MSSRLTVDAGWDGVLRRIDSDGASDDIAAAYEDEMRLRQEREPVCPECGSETRVKPWSFSIRDLCWCTVLVCPECLAKYSHRLITGAIAQCVGAEEPKPPDRLGVLCGQMKAVGRYVKRAFDEGHWWILLLPFVIWGILAAVDSWH